MKSILNLSTLLIGLFLLLAGQVLGNELDIKIINTVSFSGDGVLYHIQANLSEADPITIHVSLLHEGATVNDHFVRLAQDQSNYTGYLEIPLTSGTGNYYLILSGFNKSESKEVIFHAEKILVIDPFVESSYIASSDPPIADSDQSTSKRSTLTLPATLDFAYAVDYRLNPKEVSINYDEDDKWSQDIYVPVQVTKVYENDFNLTSLPLITAYSQRTHKLHRFSRIGQNEYLLEMPELVGEDKIKLYCNAYQQMVGFDWAVIKPDELAQLDFTFEGIPSHLKSLVESRRKEKTVSSYFNQNYIDADTLAQTNIPYPVSDNEIDFRIYENLGTVGEFFEEIYTNIRTKKIKGEKELITLKREDSGDFYHTLFIVDNDITMDSRKIVPLQVKDLKTIKMYFDSEKLKDEFGGVSNNTAVAIIDSRNGIPLIEENPNNVLFIKGFSKIKNLSIQSKDQANLPSINPVLFVGRNVSSLHISDRAGSYVVHGYRNTNENDKTNYTQTIQVQ